MKKILFATCIITLNLLSPLFWKKAGGEAFAQTSRLWSTYYGGTGGDYGRKVATDAAGNVYLTGSTNSASGIASGGFKNFNSGNYDAYLVKFDPSGTRLWATYYGGAGQDYGNSVTTDIAGNVYLAGLTDSPTGIASGGFQNTYGGNGDAYLVKFDASGARLWATYYGGTDTDWGNSVATDAMGSVYLAGETKSASGIASGGFQNITSGDEAFLVKFDASGGRLWATYYGGTAVEVANSIATDGLGNVYLSGNTYSSSGIASGGFQNIIGSAGISDAFLVKFDASGGRLWATYYGGTDTDYGYGITTDITGNVYLAGDTRSASGIASGGFQNVMGGGTLDDAYLVKFDASGQRLWATYYGGTDDDYANSVATDVYGNVYLCGDAYSIAGIASGGFQNNLVGHENQFVVKFDGCGTRLCATYFGQGPFPFDDENGHVALDGFGNIYLSGQTESPTGIASGGSQNTLGGGQDAYLVKFTSCSNTFLTNVVSTNISCNGQCAGTGTAIPVSCNSPYIYLWSNGQTTQTVTGLCAGTYTVIVIDAASSVSTNTVTITQPSLFSASLSAISNVACFGGSDGSATAISSGGTNPYTYLWSNGKTTPSVNHLPSSIYSVTVIDANGCITSQTVIITQPTIITLTTSVTEAECSANTGIAIAAAGGGIAGYTYNWSTGQTTPTVTGLAAGNYTVTITDANGCTQTQIIDITQTTGPTALASANPDSISFGASTILNASGGISYQWKPETGLTCATCVNPIASPQATTIYCVVVTDGNGCSQSACITVVVDTICEEIFVPTAFSPNADINNELLCIYGTNCIKSLIFSIYNRWGNKVFETNNSKVCWDGIYQIEEMNEGIFVYYLNAVLQDKKVITKRGNITLIK